MRPLNVAGPASDVISGSNRDIVKMFGHDTADKIGSLPRKTLVLLRWAAIGGQAITLLIVSLVLGFAYPVLICSLIIGLTALVNVIVILILPLDRHVSNREAVFQLGFDIWQLALLLWFTGGMINPFAILFLAPIVTAATTLSYRVLFSLSAFSAILSFGLLFNYHPLPWEPAGSFELPFTFRLGLWLSIAVSSGITAVYIWRATRESRKMASALTATESMLAQEQKLSALGGLAAAAAHELGTPLATIQIIAKEMSRELPEDSPLGEDARLMLLQTQRCRGILEQLSIRGDAGDVIHDVLSVEALLEEAAEPFIGLGKDISITTEGADGRLELRRQPELIYGLKNYIENAVNFANRRVELSAFWTEQELKITIDDDGRGFDAAIKNKLGQPYVTRRKNNNEAGGLGLGVFIASTLIERTNGRVTFSDSPTGGARVSLRWSRNVL
ncbi:MAG: ActS/PrrB/RegB family redox-sensitive histidine kinase [Litorimonas sp.]